MMADVDTFTALEGHGQNPFRLEFEKWSQANIQDKWSTFFSSEHFMTSIESTTRQCIDRLISGSIIEYVQVRCFENIKEIELAPMTPQKLPQSPEPTFNLLAEITCLCQETAANRDNEVDEWLQQQNKKWVHVPREELNKILNRYRTLWDEANDRSNEAFEALNEFHRVESDMNDAEEAHNAEINKMKKQHAQSISDLHSQMGELEREREDLRSVLANTAKERERWKDFDEQEATLESKLEEKDKTIKELRAENKEMASAVQELHEKLENSVRFKETDKVPIPEDRERYEPYSDHSSENRYSTRYLGGSASSIYSDEGSNSLKMPQDENLGMELEASLFGSVDGSVLTTATTPTTASPMASRRPPYNDYFVPILRQIARHRDTGKIVPYEELGTTDRHQYSELQAFGIILSHFAHGDHSPGGKLDIRKLLEDLGQRPAIQHANLAGSPRRRADLDERLQEIIDAFDAEYRHVEEVVKRLHEEKKSLTEKVEATEKALEDSNVHLTNATVKLEKTRAELNKHKLDFGNLESQYQSCMDDGKQLRERADSQSTIINEKDNLLRDQEHNLRRRTEEMEEKADSIQTLQTKLHEETAKTSQILIDLARKKDEILFLQKSLQEVQAETKVLKRHVGVLEEEKGEWQRKEDALVKASDQNAHRLKEALAKLVALEKTRSEVRTLQDTNDTLLTENEKLQEQIKAAAATEDCKCSGYTDFKEQAVATVTIAVARAKEMETQLEVTINEERGRKEEGGTASAIAINDEEQQRKNAELETRNKDLQIQLDQALDMGRKLLKFYLKMQQVIKKYRLEKDRLVHTILPNHPSFMEDMDLYLKADIKKLVKRRDAVLDELKSASEDDKTKLEHQKQRLVREIEKYEAIIEELGIHSVLADEALVVSEVYRLDPERRLVEQLLIENQITDASLPAVVQSSHASNWLQLLLLLLATALFAYGFAMQQYQRRKWASANRFSRALWMNGPQGDMMCTWIQLFLWILLNMKRFYEVIQGKYARI